MLKLNEFRTMLKEEEKLLNESLSKVTGGGCVTTFEVSFDANTGQAIDSSLTDDCDIE